MVKEDLTVKEAAVVLGVHHNTIRNYIRSELLKPYRDRLGIQRFPLADLLRFRKDSEALKRKSQSLGKKLFELKQRDEIKEAPEIDA